MYYVHKKTQDRQNIPPLAVFIALFVSSLFFASPVSADTFQIPASTPVGAGQYYTTLTLNNNKSTYLTSDTSMTISVSGTIRSCSNGDWGFAIFPNHVAGASSFGSPVYNSGIILNSTLSGSLSGGSFTRTIPDRSVGTHSLPLTGVNYRLMTGYASLCNPRCEKTTSWNSCSNCSCNCYDLDYQGASPRNISQTYTVANPLAGCVTPWGLTLDSGQSVTAYQNSSAACGSSCVSQTRTCTNGTLSGSYTNRTCSVASCPCTLPWGGSIAHGASVTAYRYASVLCGATCTNQQRTCNNGTLSGSYTNRTCTAGACSGNSCFQTVGPATFNNAVTQCQAIGTGWNMVYAESHWSALNTFNQSGLVRENPTAISNPHWCSFDPSKESTKASLFSASNNCVGDVPRTDPFLGICYNANCGASFSCSGTVPNGTTRIMCPNDDTSLHTNGTWTNKGATSASCTETKCEYYTPVSSCTTPWGTNVPEGDSVTAYQNSSVACGASCASQTRTCTSGVLSGTYTHQSCSVNPCADCALPWGGTIADGDTVTAYQSASVACGSSCTSQTRTCTNGTLSGGYTNQSCHTSMCLSVTASPTDPEIGENVIWTAIVSGGVPPYTYSWTNSCLASGVGVSTCNRAFGSIGPKTVTVTVSDTDTSAATPDVSDSKSVTVEDNRIQQ
jgi:hypothetical protein